MTKYGRRKQRKRRKNNKAINFIKPITNKQVKIDKTKSKIQIFNKKIHEDIENTFKDILDSFKKKNNKVYYNPPIHNLNFKKQQLLIKYEKQQLLREHEKQQLFIEYKKQPLFIEYKKQPLLIEYKTDENKDIINDYIIINYNDDNNNDNNNIILSIFYRIYNFFQLQ